MDPNHEGSALGSSVSNEANGNSSLYASLWILIQQGFTRLVISMQASDPKVYGWKQKTIYGLYYLYIFWITIFLPTLGRYNWGEWGNWLFTVANYPITLSLDLVPFVAIVPIAAACIVLVLSALVSFALAIHAIFRSSKHLDRIKKTASLLGNVVHILSMIVTFIFSSFIDCKSTELVSIEGYDEKVSLLTRFDNIPCSSEGNIVLIVLGVIALFSLLVINFLTVMINQESEQTVGGFLISDNGLTMAFLAVFNPFQLYVMYVIPEPYIYVRSIVHILFTTMLMVLVFFYLPFYRRVENSCILGLFGARMGAAIGALVTSLVNTGRMPDLGIGLAGMTIGLMVLGALFFFSALEIYSRVIYNRVRGRFMVSIKRAEALSSILRRSEGLQENEKLPLKMLEKEASLVYQEFEEDGRLRHLNMFMKFSMKSTNKTESEQITDVEIALSLIKGASLQKSFSDARLLLTCSLIVAYYWKNEVNSQVFATSLLKKAIKAKPNFIYKFLIAEREKEFEMIDNSHSFELKFFLERMDKNQTELFALHRSFWKEMTNDVLNLDKIEQTNRRASELMSECESTFNNLMAKHRNNKTVLRYYASYVEKFKFNKDLSQELYQEAMAIEDEEAKWKTRPNKKGGGKKNRVVPNFSMNFEEAPPPPSTKFAESNIKSFSFGNHRKSAVGGSTDFNDNFDDLENDNFERQSEMDLGSQRLDGVENNPQLKRESVLRSSLATPQQHSFQLFTFFVFTIVSFLIVAAGIIWNSIISKLVLTDIQAVQSACKPRMIPLYALKDLRILQTFDYLYGSNMNVEERNRFLNQSGYNSVTDFVVTHQNRLGDAISFINKVRVMGQAGLFTAEMYSDYTSETREIIVPFVSTPNTIGIYNESYSASVSISEIVYSMMKHITYFQNLDLSQYSKTLSSYPFMYLWLNQDSLEKAFDNFCLSFIQRTQDKSELLSNSFFLFFVISNSIYAFLSLVFIIYISVNFSNLKTYVRLLEKNVPKDVVGKIYHNLGKQAEDETSIHLPKSILKPYMSAAILGVVVICITVLCCGMFYMESSYNASSTFRTMQNIRDATSALSAIQRIGFNVGEMYTYIMLNQSSINDPRLSKGRKISDLNTNLASLKSNLVVSWNSLVYGKISDNKKSSVGISPKIDSFIQDVANCTSNNGTSTIACIGLEHLIELFSQDSSQNSADIFSAKEDLHRLFLEHVSTYVLGHGITQKLLLFLDAMVAVFSVSSVAYVISFSIVGCLLLLACCLGLYSIFNAHWNNIFHVRMMFNYIPLDLMDSEESMRNFIMYHTVPSRIFTKKRESKENAKNDDSKVRNILNAAVDGAVLCSHRGDIEIFNPAAQRMFGCKQSDFVGLPLFHLFDASNRDKLNKVIEDIIKATKDTSTDAQGETIEVECIRKNNTKFPAKVNLFSTLFDNKPVVTCFIKDITSEKKQNALLAEEKKKSENLLRSILPEAVANRLKAGETFIAEKFNDITCFFSDMVGFTSISSGLNPTELVMMLNTVVNGFDSLTDKYQLEKIKTIGDAYFCVGGIGNTQSDHPERTLKFAIDIFHVLRAYNLENRKEFGHQINIRVGINTGGVVAGVIGTKKFAYDLWGDTINMASRMESTSLAGRIQISRSTYERVYDLGFEFEERSVEVKGKGNCNTYLLKAHHHVSALVTEEEAAAVSRVSASQNAPSSNNDYQDSIGSKDSEQLEYQLIQKRDSE
ncbi:hypothetical protein C9374_003576 [Naegleria lovaniensis]|uniref:Adenylate and Guanylate cyclase catalytic domain containing protein n=1 Tax=Naegleria lovaniensis TaxID=51637 RepID=A0AA88H7G0_NAELO|nr:uncharacterized protein C9374_003576 [Naegleria lovaniensis]KAG2393812.1 hypothetical protein C9374_003576 [Naegleria lovaniensis]